MVAKWSDPPKPKRRRKAVPLCETAFALSEQQANALHFLRTVVAPQLAGLASNAEALELAENVLQWALERVYGALEVRDDYSHLAR